MRAAGATCCALPLAALALAAMRAAPVPVPPQGRDQAEARAAPAEVFASFHPLADFARRIGGDAVVVVCPVPSGADPARWLPERAQVERMQAASLVLVHGAAYERWVDFVSLPLATTVVTTRPFRERLLPATGSAVHAHGRDGAPAHSGVDPHTWLSPELARAEARAVLAALSARLPEHADVFARRYARLEQELDAWAAELGRLTDALAGELLVATHPSYEYLARDHGWRIANVPIERDAVPDEPTLERLRELRRAGARLVLWEGTPASETRDAFARERFHSVEYATCETRPDDAPGPDGGFLAAMRANVARLETALRTSR